MLLRELSINAPLRVTYTPSLYLHLADLFHHNASHVLLLKLLHRFHMHKVTKSNYFCLHLFVLPSLLLGYLLLKVGLLVVDLDHSLFVLESVDVCVELV